MEKHYSKQQEEIITNEEKIKILMVSHPYNTHDKLIGIPIIEYLSKLEVIPVLADLAPKKSIKKKYSKISPKLYWSYSKELVGAIEYYKKDIDGIIYFSTFPCGPDSLVNELCLRKINNIPCCNIVIDELQSEVGLYTRLESFIDIIREKKNKVSIYEE
jgi:predicted nucleotide-binding protein (sugar kinase/HSP70/actin superfamily)